MLTTANRAKGLGAALIVLAVGCQTPRRHIQWDPQSGSNTYDSPADEIVTGHTLASPNRWVCPMHPQIEQSEPGECPICGMDLVSSDESSATEPSALGHSPSSGHSSAPADSHLSGSGCSHCG